MALLFKYIKDRKWQIFMQFLYAAIFCGVFHLYDLPVRVVLYATGLCAALAGVVFAWNYFRYINRHRCLQEQMFNVDVSLYQLPEPGDEIEADYQRLLRQSSESRIRRETQIEGEKQDLIEYYTLWAHQIKTPIAAMGLVMQGEDSSLSRSLQPELFRVEQYVEMALNYLRLGSDTSDLLIQEYDLENIVRQPLRKYASIFIRKRISLQLSPIHAQVLTDEKWLCFAIEQVLSNALKYTPKGKIFIYVQDEAVLVIRDTGIGIAPEDLPRVFDRGFTGLNGRADKRATGIGLYLTRRILKRLGHDISIESELGQGTVVRIDLRTSLLDTRD